LTLHVGPHSFTTLKFLTARKSAIRVQWVRELDGLTLADLLGLVAPVVAGHERRRTRADEDTLGQVSIGRLILGKVSRAFVPRKRCRWRTNGDGGAGSGWR